MPVAHETTNPAYTPIKAARGNQLSCKGWAQEAALRMLQNNLDEDVAERPQDLVVYGGTGRAARNWDCYHAIVRSLQALENDETLLVQSGRPVGVLRTHEWAPRVLIANSNLVPDWATWPEFRRLEHLGLTMYGQMTAGSWIYIGTQGILQGTYETFAAIAAKRFGVSRKNARIIWLASLLSPPTASSRYEAGSSFGGGFDASFASWGDVACRLNTAFRLAMLNGFPSTASNPAASKRCTSWSVQFPVRATRKVRVAGLGSRSRMARAT